MQVGATENQERLAEGYDGFAAARRRDAAPADLCRRQPGIIKERVGLDSARRDAAPTRLLESGPGLEQRDLESRFREAACCVGAGRPASDNGDTPHRIDHSGIPRRAAIPIYWTTMKQAAGKGLELTGMLTLGVALFVYGFGEQDMNAELGWLIVGSLVFLVGFVLENIAPGSKRS
jgi:hypothetical protein